MADRVDAAFVIADLGAGGAQSALVRAAAGLVRRGRRVAVVTLSGSDGDFHRLPEGVVRIALDAVGESSNPLMGLVRNLGRVRALRRALVESRARAALSFVTQTNILAVLAGWGLGMRIVVSERNDPRKQALSGVWRRLRDLLYPRAAVVTANSQGAVDALAAEIPGIAPVLLPNPAPAPAFEPAGIARPSFILNVARLHRQKGQDVLLDAFAAFAPYHPQVRLVVAGEGGARESLEARARALGIADRVDMPGAVADVAGLYGQGPVFVLPSRHEGTPNALLEAMAHGLACAASACSPGVAASLRDGQEGLLVPPEDAVALAAALRRLFEDPDLRARLAVAAHARAVERARADGLEVWERVLGLV
jgi:GalNAc-alpha-(1->4)-GalNAc-alpha-(1->3)-diNAcBac-PP-undecaprenol alpha-1,4-N-acetyl-D-galactosaminyltransferase